MTMPAGSVIGSIVVEEKLSSGATGEHYLGRQPALERTVALHKLPRNLSASPGVIERFQREARLGAQVLHPNLVQVFDLFSHRGDHYLVREHVEGAELSAVLERSGRLPARIVVRIVLELARALGELHRRGIVHCDVCPENVLVSRWGEIKLTGLGSAQQAGEAEPPSPPPPTPYSAPELREGGGADPQVDVFSLGALLHVLLVGRAPGHPGGPVLAAHPQLAWLIRRCLRQEPARRPDLLSIRRRLERALPREAADCRMEIAAWFWDVRMQRPSIPELPEEPPPAESPSVARGLPRWGLPLAAAGGIGLAVLLVQLGGSDDEQRAAAPARPLPEVAAVKPAEEPPAVLAEETGQLVFVAHPWAEIQIDEQAPFLTPRAAPIELAPGPHQLLFRHPRYGEVRESIVVRPGEQRLVRHVFPGAQP
jgi:hypothetical protein